MNFLFNPYQSFIVRLLLFPFLEVTNLLITVLSITVFTSFLIVNFSSKIPETDIFDVLPPMIESRLNGLKTHFNGMFSLFLWVVLGYSLLSLLCSFYRPFHHSFHFFFLCFIWSKSALHFAFLSIVFFTDFRLKMVHFIRNISVTKGNATVTKRNTCVTEASRSVTLTSENATFTRLKPLLHKGVTFR
ncbi:MAG: hypothetical protein HRT73_07550 [Flavobacteriales bacterium]|nr:hypothetical protein [Flavobacteriales bacterium]